MILELRVRELGVIVDINVAFSAGLTAITGETGAGKTLVVEALELLVGGRSDVSFIRHGAEKALVEGRFANGEEETILARTIPRTGRSRASIDDRMATLSTLEERGRALLDLHGQHAHQSLLRASAQRHALDEYAKVELDDVRRLRASIAQVEQLLAALGGDDRAKARELDLLAFELEEIDRARLEDADEDERLAEEESRLSRAGELRGATETAYESLEGGSGPGATDLLGDALQASARYDQLDPVSRRLRDVAAELADLAAEMRRLAEGFEEDPARLAEVSERRQLLRRLVRKHGDSLADVFEAADRLRARVDELSSSEERRSELEAERDRLRDELTRAESAVGEVRRGAAAALATDVERHLRELALSGASFEVRVGEGFGDDVEFLIAANKGEPPQALAKVASGGELARVMLALRLVLTSAPPTLVFDEVDAGIGGQAALAVGRALAALGREHQVLVVTHLAQVAAFADHQLVVEKDEQEGRTTSRLRAVEGEGRVVELSRMLSGHPDSDAARRHASELLEMAQVARP